MSETSKTVTSALRLLCSFNRDTPTFTVAEIVRELQLPRTNVLRLLASLQSFGFIERDLETGRYRVGLRALELGSLFLDTNPISNLFSGALDELVARTQCTAYLAIMDKDDIVMLNCREGTFPVRFVWSIGARLPATTTAMGKAILMNMSSDEIDAHLGKRKKLRTLTKKSLTSREELERELNLARKRGWGSAQDESYIGLTSVGSVILDRHLVPVAAISISYLDHPPEHGRMERYGQIVQSVAKDVSQKIATRSGFETIHTRAIQGIDRV